MKLRLLLLLFSSLSSLLFAQSAGDTLPYMKNRELPSFNLLSLDSTEFNTSHIKEGRKIMMVYFSPNCDHCEQLTTELIQHQDKWTDVEIYMITPLPLLSTLREFDSKYHVSQQKQMHLYQEPAHLFLDYYGVRSFPYIALYDEHKMFVKAFPNGVRFEELMETVTGKK
ncbi:MAG TPA: thioredoxin fold domain-containing protein [Flavipsychrobacter sp.]|nr:thioredoxin fold domain-containing protein [Flavipsychrobacter sp.]